MDQQEFKLQIAEVAGTWLAAVTVVVGGFFGVFQYLEHKDAVRVDRTMAFVERYHSDGLLMDSRLQLTHSMTLNVDDINNILINPDTKPDDLAKNFNDGIMEIVLQDSLAGPLEQIFTFYEQIIVCRELELCDATVAQQFFDTDALGYVRTFYPYVCAIRSQWNNPAKYAKLLDFYLPKAGSICAV